VSVFTFGPGNLLFTSHENQVFKLCFLVF
jgi:hypothetical protein